MVPKGVCHLCGKERGLTYEHVPARSSFNADAVKMFGLESWLGRDADGAMRDGQRMEQGAGAYTLCYECNSEISGNHYVGELKRWTAIGMSALSRVADGEEGNAVALSVRRVYPLRILKQMVVMLASVNAAELLDHHRELREFAMDPRAMGLSPRYRFYLVFTHLGSTVGRYAGLSMRLAPGTWCATWVSDLVWPPFGYVMTIDEPQPLLPIGDVTHFAAFGYDERVDLEMKLPVLLGTDPYPGEYEDPVANGAFTRSQPAAFPTSSSVRFPVHLRLVDGYQTDGAELSHPSGFDQWKAEDLFNVVEALLRGLCVQKGEHYTLQLFWSEGEGAMVQVLCDDGRAAETEFIPIPGSAVAAFSGNDVLPPKAVITKEEVMRFLEPGEPPMTWGKSK